MLTRIYGTAFFTKAELEEHLERLELARARDHRRLGRELGLFPSPSSRPGTAFWTPHGTTLWNTLRDLAGEMTRARGYTEVKTPQLYRRAAVADLRPLGQLPREHVRHRPTTSARSGSSR